MTPEKLSFRPHARLLTMLGDQLIKNERIALVELIKNAYDADASQVEVRFEEFGEDMTHDERSRIVVQDDGVGMTPETVRARWMNPAAPGKYLDKRQGREKTPGKGRVLQGEKGIGRFAVLKLGRKITITTRPRKANTETVLTWNFLRFDDDFLLEDSPQKEIFLDEIRVDCSRSRPTRLPGAKHGTVIEIENLKGAWNKEVISRLCRDVSNLTDPVSRITGSASPDRFKISVVCNGERQPVEADDTETLKFLIEERAVLNIRGTFCSQRSTFSFTTHTDSDKEEISLEDAKITGLWVWRRRFREVRGSASAKQMALPHLPGADEFTCGDFAFQFHIFDFSRAIDGRHALEQAHKDLLKDHRIYLYRDAMRVYPYGDPDDDWLNIDVTRGIGRAGNFFSNDQIIGWIDITQKGNPALRDKTNREGLIETGGAAGDLIFLVQTFLSYVKQHPFARYQQRQQQRNSARLVRDGTVTRGLAALKEKLDESGHRSRGREVAKIEADYIREKAHLSQRAEVTEDLAGVGLSVEMASHDIMLLMGRAQEIGRRIDGMARASGDDDLREQTNLLGDVLQRLTDGMKDLQVVFRSSRRRRKRVSVEPELDRIYRLYKPVLEQRSIRYRKVAVGAAPLDAHTTDGVLMQVLINLFDNASYWLESVSTDEREINVTLDGDRRELVFSDSGPGIDPEDLPFIFEPFYSGKGEAGRGLGLYIARRLLARHGYSITVGTGQRQALSGATFLVSFAKDDDQ